MAVRDRSSDKDDHDSDVVWGGGTRRARRRHQDDADADDASEGGDVTVTALNPSTGPAVLGGGTGAGEHAESATYAARASKDDNAAQSSNTSAAIRHEIAGALGVADDSNAVDQAYAELAVAQRDGAFSPSGEVSSASEVRHEIAGALGVADDDPAVDLVYTELGAAQRVAADVAWQANKDAIIHDALTQGRRIEQVDRFDPSHKYFTELIPKPSGIDGDAVARFGEVWTLPDGSEEVRTRYVDPSSGDLWPIATVTSKREGGIETITNVDERVPGSTDLKVGDTRDIPADLTTAAGLAPSTFDPKRDGSLGTSRPPTSHDGSTGWTDSDGGSHDSSSSSTSDTSGRTGTHAEDPYTPPPDDGAGDSGGGSSGGETNHGSSEATGNVFRQVTQATAGADGEAGTRTESVRTEYKNEDGTYTYVTTTTTTDSNGKVETEMETETTDTQKSTEGYIADDGYSSAGTLPEGAHFVTGGTDVVAGDVHVQQTYSGVFGTFTGTLVHAETGNPESVSGDYGNPNDENAAGPPTHDDVHVPTADPLIHVDPGLQGDAETLSLEQHDLQTAIHGGDYGNPNDPLFGDGNTPMGHGDDTSPYEHDTDDFESEDDGFS